MNPLKSLQKSDTNEFNPATYSRLANKEKVEVLEKYALVYGEENVLQYNILPILLSKPYLLSKMETFYDRQFEEILKKKSFIALDFPKIVHDSMKSKFKESRNYFVQSLSNIIYSSDKYSDENEVTLFLEFCQKKGENQKLMFYLFLRQHFKILTYTTFLSHNKTSSDPSKISITLENAFDIITVAFSHEKTASTKFYEEVKNKFQKSQKIYYYEFMMVCMKVRFVYSDLPMLEKALALYKVTNFMDLANVFAQKPGSQTKDQLPKEQKTNLINIESKVIRAPTITVNNTQNITVGTTPVNEISFLQQTANNARIGTSFMEEKSVDVSRSKIDQVKINPVNRGFYETVKNELKPFADRLIANYSEKMHSKQKDSALVSANLSLQIQKKYYFLINTIFGEDRKKFFGLLRTDLGSDDKMLDFWMDLQDLLKETQRMGLTNSKIASEFLFKLFNYAIINQQTMFLLSFRLQANDELFDIELNV